MITIALTLSLLASAPEAQPATPTLSPHEAVLAQVQALRKDDVEGLIRSLVTDAQFEAMEAAWEEERKRTPDATEDAQFTDFVARFSSPNAEEELWPELEAALAEMRPQLGMMTAMFSAMAEGAITEEASLSREEREQAQKVIQVVEETLQNKDLTSPKLARQALGIVCETVRSLEVQDLEDVYALTFDQLLARAGLALRGTKELLELYGFELNGWLSSFEAKTLHSTGDTAVVEVKFSILGMEEISQVEMTRIGGRWFQQQATEQASRLGK